MEPPVAVTQSSRYSEGCRRLMAKRSAVDFPLPTSPVIRVTEPSHQRVHSVPTQQPRERFSSHLECVRPAPPTLEDFFRKRTLRNVAKDRSVALQGRLYEAPLGLLGKRVVLFYHDHDPSRVEVFWEDRSYGFMSLLDERVNFRVRRDHHRIVEIRSEAKGSEGGRLLFREEEPR